MFSIFRKKKEYFKMFIEEEYYTSSFDSIYSLLRILKLIETFLSSGTDMKHLYCPDKKTEIKTNVFLSGDKNIPEDIEDVIIEVRRLIKVNSKDFLKDKKYINIYNSYIDEFNTFLIRIKEDTLPYH